MNNARQSIHWALDSMMEDARIALGNQFVGLRLDGGGCMNSVRQSIHGAPNKI